MRQESSAKMNEMSSMKCRISTAFSMKDVMVASAFDMPEAESAMNVPLQLIDRAPYHACSHCTFQKNQPIRLPLASGSRRIPFEVRHRQTRGASGQYALSRRRWPALLRSWPDPDHWTCQLCRVWRSTGTGPDQSPGSARVTRARRNVGCVVLEQPSAQSAC